MNKDLIEKIRHLKNEYEKDGFIILGIFGSYARGDFKDNSDIDILYELKDNFYKRYPGFEIYTAIDKIEKRIQDELKRDVDLANKNALNEIGCKYILPEVIYV